MAKAKKGGKPPPAEPPSNHIVIGKGLPKGESQFSMTVNGHTLLAQTTLRLWAFECPDFPDLVQKHQGKPDSGPMVAEFTERAAGTALSVKLSMLGIILGGGQS